MDRRRQRGASALKAAVGGGEDLAAMSFGGSFSPYGCCVMGPTPRMRGLPKQAGPVVSGRTVTSALVVYETASG